MVSASFLRLLVSYTAEQNASREWLQVVVGLVNDANA